MVGVRAQGEALFEEIKSRYGPPRRVGNDWWKIHCPNAATHNRGDRDRSGTVKLGQARILFKCFVGCSYEEMADATGYGSDGLLFSKKDRREIDAIYPYTDRFGALKYEVVRYWPKEFRQRKPSGDGWSWSLKDVDKVPYRLPDIYWASVMSDTVYFVEGEKDADRLAEEGLIASCVAGGTSGWSNGMRSWFRNTPVVVIPDNDEPGHKFMDLVAAALAMVTKVQILHLPVKEGGDVSDYLMDNDVVDLLELAAKAPPWSPPQTITFTEEPRYVRNQGWIFQKEEAELIFTDPVTTADRLPGLWSEVTVNWKGLLEPGEIMSATRINIWSSSKRGEITRRLEKFRPEFEHWDKLFEAATGYLLRQNLFDLRVKNVGEITELDSSWVVENFIAQPGPSVLAAQRSSGKSLLALSTGIAVAAGRPDLIGLEIPISGDVLYLDWETDASTFVRRVKAICSANNLDVPPGIRYLRPEHPLSVVAYGLNQHLQDVGYKLVIVDSMGMAMRGSPDNPGEVMEFFATIRSFKTPALVIAHKSREAAKRSMKQVFGSTYTENIARVAWDLETKRDNGDLLMQMECFKANDFPIEGWKWAWRASFGMEQGMMKTARLRRVEPSEIGDAFDPSKESAESLVEGILAGSGQALSIGELVDESGRGPYAVRQAVGHLISAGTIVDVGVGGLSMYTLKVRDGRQELPDPM